MSADVQLVLASISAALGAFNVLQNLQTQQQISGQGLRSGLNKVNKSLEPLIAELRFCNETRSNLEDFENSAAALTVEKIAEGSETNETDRNRLDERCYATFECSIGVILAQKHDVAKASKKVKLDQVPVVIRDDVIRICLAYPTTVQKLRTLQTDYGRGVSHLNSAELQGRCEALLRLLPELMTDLRMIERSMLNVVLYAYGLPRLL